MRTRLTVLFATLAVAAVAIPSAASAATLYTTSAQKTAVPVGTTFTASATVPIVEKYVWVMYSGPSAVNGCEGTSLSYKVTQNSGGVFKATLTAGGNVVKPGCAAPMEGISHTGNVLQISGSSVVNGANTAWLSSTISNVGWKATGLPGQMFGSLTSATGSPPKNGVFSQQPTAAKAPVSVVLEHAATAECIGVWPGCSASATYTLTGAAAAYSLG